MVYVIGEALIDLVQGGESVGSGSVMYTARPGGSPFNVALGLARLGQPTRLMARLSSDAFGRQLRGHAAANGVDISLAVDAREPSTLAIVGLDDNGNARYDFYVNGTADWQWTGDELGRVPDDAEWVHTGSLASWTEPGAAVISEQLVRLRAANATVISYDPNIRPALMPDHAAAVAMVESTIGHSHVVKASAEDLDWLYPGSSIPEVLGRWRLLGPVLAVVTDGGRGAHAITRDGAVVTVPAKPITVVDTVGAGDAFMSGLINALAGSGLAEVVADGDTLNGVLSQAMLVAALTCQRAGADPPSAAELKAALEG